MLDCVCAEEGNESSDGFIARVWQGQNGERLLGIVNYSPQQGQCFVPVPFNNLPGRRYRLNDLMGPASFDHSGDGLLVPGLYLDLASWGCLLHELLKAP